MTRIGRFTMSGLGAFALAMVALGADAPKPQTVDVGGLTFEAPATWKSSKPSSTMRKAQLAVAPAEGDADGAELVVFVFPGGAGTVESNVERWRKQFQDAEGRPPEVVSKSLKGKNTQVTRVEVAGKYRDPFSQAGEKPNYRLLGAIVVTGDAGYFLKMVGPDKTMKAATTDFDALIASIATK